MAASLTLDGLAPLSRCGIDTVEIARIERLLKETSRDDLLKIFSADELTETGDPPTRAARIAARFAAKEACLKLFPRETALGLIGPADFAVARNGYGAPGVVCSPRARVLLERHRLSAIALSLTHDKDTAAAVAVTQPVTTAPPRAGTLIYHLLPIRRRTVLANLQRVFADTVPADEIRRMAQAHYAHLARSFVELAGLPWLSPARRAALVRVENMDVMTRAHAQGKGVLVLTGHFGNWELATVVGLANFPQYRGQFHVVRRSLAPRWLDRLVTRRFRRVGFGVIPKQGALDVVLERLAAGDSVVFTFDQHAGGRDGVAVEFFGQPCGTFRSLALIALSTGAPVVPATSWREPDGNHVLRFEEPVSAVDCDDPGEAIRATTRAYNAVLERLVLRHPEQWFWMHRRWKDGKGNVT